MAGAASLFSGGLPVALAREAASADTERLYLLSTFTLKRPQTGAPDIIYYLSYPKTAKSFPIVILIGGSSDNDSVASITEFHRYFLQNLEDIGVAALTVEQWGVNEHHIDKKVFMAHYTRTQRLSDHQIVIDELRRSAPPGWNGKLALLAVSEGGNIATTLISNRNNAISATVIWSGAGDWSLREELWPFMRNLCSGQSATDISECRNISTRKKYDSRLDDIALHPSAQLYFFNMTNMYMADAMKFPEPDYKNFHGELLMVSGVKDTLIKSSDDYYRKATRAGVDVTYWRVEDMDHSIRNRPELIERSFVWLKQQLRM